MVELGLFQRLRAFVDELHWEPTDAVGELVLEEIVEYYLNSGYKYITEFTNTSGENIYLLSRSAFNPGFGALVDVDMTLKTRVNTALHQGNPSPGPISPILVDWPYKGSTLNISTYPWSVCTKIALQAFPTKGECFYVPHRGGEIVRCTVTDKYDIQ